MLIPGQEFNLCDELADGISASGRDENSLTDNPNNFQHLGTTMLASKFAKNTRRGVAHNVRVVKPAAPSLDMPLLVKPDEPDFSVGFEDV